MERSLFEELNDGDDLFFTACGDKNQLQSGAPKNASTIESRIQELKEEIKLATDEGRYDQLGEFADEIKTLQEQHDALCSSHQLPQTANTDDRPANLPPPPINPIQASQQAAGQNSHYYWDRQPQTRLAEPDPVRVAVRQRTIEIEKIKTITKYSMADEGNWVKLYIRHEGVGLLPKGSVSCDFRERSFDLRIEDHGVGVEGSDVAYCHRLHVPVLAERTDPARCKLRVKPSQVVVSLRKLDNNHAWQELHKIYGIGETQRIEKDYGDTTNVVV